MEQNINTTLTSKSLVLCQICNKKHKFSDSSPAEVIRLAIVKLIKEKNNDSWESDGFICKPCLNDYRSLYIESLFNSEKDELSSVEKSVIENMKQQEIITQDLYKDYNEKISAWDTASDKLARFGGSWKFVLFFIGIIIFWIALNVYLATTNQAWDKYPFIFLNLILSCIAAIQAPIIMMSQNRAEARDQLRAESEYQINLKAEIGIRNLNDKMDHLLFKQWEKMSEIQQVQIEIMKEIGSIHKPIENDQKH